VESLYNLVFWLNCFPHKDGIEIKGQNDNIAPDQKEEEDVNISVR